ENDEKNCTTIEVKNSKYDNDYKYKKPLGRPKTIIEVDSTPFWEQIEKVEKNKKVILINRDVLYGNDELYKERLLPLDEDVLEKRIQNFCIPLTKKNAYSYFISDNVNEFYENRVLECYNLKQQCFTMSQRERLENALLLIKEALESQKFASDIEIHQKAVANAKSKRKLVEDMTQEEYLDFCDERDKYKNNEDIDDFGDILP
ncbi:MAG: hypothetical protein LBV51_00025, partial [Acholeplasmatales bacterium]|nr:hypothetical protein [Acholeplasmatales bacterium]